MSQNYWRCYQNGDDWTNQLVAYFELSSVLHLVPSTFFNWYSLFHMLYDKDPILPFQLADKSDILIGNSSEIDPFSECLLQLANGREQVFNQVKENIKKHMHIKVSARTSEMDLEIHLKLETRYLKKKQMLRFS